MQPPTPQILEFRGGFWILVILDFGFRGFWILGILDFKGRNPKSSNPKTKKVWFLDFGLDRYVANVYVVQISGILDFGDFGFWIWGLLDFGFGDFGFWILGILDFGLWGFWILDFGSLCSKSLCEAPNAPNLVILDFGDFGDFGFWGFWILNFWILGILDFGFWGLGDEKVWVQNHKQILDST